jgi:hypothetical protein
LDIDSGPGFAPSIQGQLLRHSEHREVAIFLRDGALWVADFIDGNGQLIDATTWFRFNCAALFSSHAQRRMALESAIPLSPELVARIQRLHCPVVAPKRAAALRVVNTTNVHGAPGHLLSLIAGLLARRRTPRGIQAK